MDQEKIDPGHSGIRNVLRIAGPVILAVGLIFLVVGIASFFSSVGQFGPPKYFWCVFVGMPLIFVGIVLTGYGFMGKVARYQAGEVAPVVKDTFNYVAKGGSEGIKTVAAAIGEGLRSGSTGKQDAKVRCHKCNSLQDSEAKFCDDCGTALGKARGCPQCREMNDPDAKFCDNCGYEFG